MIYMFVARHRTAHISNLWSIFEGIFFFFRQSDDKVLQAAKVTVIKKQSTRTQKYPSPCPSSVNVVNTILKKINEKCLQSKILGIPSSKNGTKDWFRKQ